jgi:hypothetical protein
MRLMSAIRRDVDAKRLSPPVSSSPQDDLRAARVLSQRLSLGEGFELLLIDDGSHHRIESAEQLRRLRPPIRWVTARAVLEALLEKRLDLETAVVRGLVVVEKTSVAPIMPAGKREQRRS